MSTDIENTYADEADIASTSFTSDGEVDHGGVTGRGMSRGLYFVIANRILWTAATVKTTFLLEQSATNSTDGAWSATTIGTYDASVPKVPAGELIANVPLPTVTQRYTRVSGSWTTSETKTGAISAFLTTDPQFTFEGRAAVVTL